MHICVLTHTYPSSDMPWCTPFIKHYVDALTDLGEELDVSVIIPELDADPLAGKEHIVQFKLPSTSNIPHKRLAKANNTTSPLDAVTYTFKSVQSVKALHKKKPIDAIHAHWSIPSGLTAMIARILLGIPYFVTTHGKDVLPPVERGNNVLSNPLLKAVIRRVLLNAHNVVTTSSTTLQAAKDIAPTANFISIPIGVSESFSSHSSKDGKRSGFLYVGDLVQGKGIDTILEAASLLGDRLKERITIVGHGPELEALKSLALDKDVRVDFLGPLQQSQVIEHMRTSRAVISGSRVEAFGITMLEAIFSNTPLIVTPVGIAPELNSNPALKRYVKLFPIGDKETLAKHMLELLDRPLVVDESATEQLKQNYSWSSIAKRHSEYFRRTYRDSIKS